MLDAGCRAGCRMLFFRIRHPGNTRFFYFGTAIKGAEDIPDIPILIFSIVSGVLRLP
jgi:hypothetical protein